MTGRSTCPARLLLCGALLALSGAAQAVPVFTDFETVDNVVIPLSPSPTSVGAVTSGIVLSANSEVNDEFKIFRITSGLAASNPLDTFGGVSSWVEFTAPRAAHSGSRVIAGASTVVENEVDFGNFIEIRVLDPGYKTVKLWVGSIAGGSASMLVTDDVNGGNTLSNSTIALDNFVEFTSPGADIRRIVLFPSPNSGIWIDDLSVDTAAVTPPSGVPVPSVLTLLAPLVVGLAMARRRPTS